MNSTCSLCGGIGQRLIRYFNSDGLEVCKQMELCECQVPGKRCTFCDEVITQDDDFMVSINGELYCSPECHDHDQGKTDFAREGVDLG